MSISYPLEFPTGIAPKRVTFYAVNAVALSRSPFTFDTQTQAFAGQSWGAEITLPAMQRDVAEEWIAFLMALQGPRGTFVLRDPLGKHPRGVATGVPLVDGANQTGNSIATKGWTISTAGILKRGDKIQLGSRLYAVMGTGDVDSDGDGKAVIDIWPRLRESPADNDSVTTESPGGIFRLAGTMTNLWASDETQSYDVNFDAVEAI